MQYNVELVAAGRDAVLANYDSKSVAYGRATRDRGDFKDIYDCAVYTTGKDRSERFFEFLKRFPATCRDPTSPTGCHTLDIVVSGHSSETMFQSEAGRTRLFLDNWAGDGSRAHDFGYPRIQVSIWKLSCPSRPPNLFFHDWLGMENRQQTRLNRSAHPSSEKSTSLTRECDDVGW